MCPEENGELGLRASLTPPPAEASLLAMPLFPIISADNQELAVIRTFKKLA